MAIHEHHDDSGGFLAANAMMMMTVLFVVLAVVLIIGLVAWQPWDNSSSDNGDNGGVDINIGGGDKGSGSGQPQNFHWDAGRTLVIAA